MGLFDKLFSKKECSICGGEIGLLGNRKLEDGNLCKNCAAKLSPWFNDRRSSTVDAIRKQLEDRESNLEKVAAFRTTRTLGTDTKLLLDEDAGKFMVTDARNLMEANPDVLDFSDVTGCVLDINEDRTEVMREDKDGNSVSYTPSRYKYEYDFHIIVQVRNPYFDEIRFQLNDHSVELGSGGVTARPNPAMSMEYSRYKEMGEEIRDTLLQLRQQTRAEAAAAAAPKAAVACPYCGAMTIPTPAGCCEYCGGSVNV